MSARFKRLLMAVSLFLFVTVAHAQVSAGDTPPDYLGKTRHGDDINISAMHGKVVVVAFWASWCTYCQKEFPVLANIQKLVSPEKLQVVAVNQDDRETFIKLVRALTKATPDLIYTYDPGEVGKTYGTTSIPRTMLVDRDGKVAYVHVGYGESTLESLADELNELLAKPATQAAAPSS
ncbi:MULTISPECIES: TlpA family protein disulfide reductase [Dyella]|uniref:TlpA family protein disulfide reductase n=2 Tax=Dyella TaxID=231454 RepID=A0A4R0YQ27_9GAMM|nr:MULTISPECIES: TlpA disulfide reductase family protein [Dyella]TBR37007.1 TlpA family protein disulfide reductase [Dyella terrae]TCI07903.1 TlpA family protein disulfide reductase [Dyella soli]